MYINSQNIEAINRMRKEKRELERKHLLSLINQTLNNEAGKKLLELIKKSLQNKKIDFNNPNYVYYNQGKLDIILMLENELEKLNKHE